MITTGSTLNEISKLLRKLGVEEIQVWGWHELNIKHWKKKRDKRIIPDTFSQVFRT